MNEYVLADLAVGHSERIEVEIDQCHVDTFMDLSGDRSTVHVDDDYARERGFEQRLVHGVLVASYISQLIGMALPGKHGVLRSLSCDFREPCYAPNRLILTGRVDRLVPSIRVAKLSIDVHDRSGLLIVAARAETVMKR